MQQSSQEYWLEHCGLTAGIRSSVWFWDLDNFCTNACKCSDRLNLKTLQLLKEDLGSTWTALFLPPSYHLPRVSCIRNWLGWNPMLHQNHSFYDYLLLDHLLDLTQNPFAQNCAQRKGQLGARLLFYLHSSFSPF